MKKLYLVPFITAIFVGSVAHAQVVPFVGDPKTRAQMLSCDVVVSKYSKRVYQKGDKRILRMAPRWASCPAPKPKPATVAPIIEKTPAQIQLELEALNMSLYGDARGPIPASPPVAAPLPQIEAPSPVQSLPVAAYPVTISQPETVVQVIPVIESAPVVASAPVRPHFVNGPYIVPDWPQSDMYGRKRLIVVDLSAPVTYPDPYDKVYQAYCTGGVNGPVWIATGSLPDFYPDLKKRVLEFRTSLFGDVHDYSCKFVFTDPAWLSPGETSVESNSISFTL